MIKKWTWKKLIISRLSTSYKRFRMDRLLDSCQHDKKVLERINYLTTLNIKMTQKESTVSLLTTS